MQRLTTRNEDNSISVERVSGQELLKHLAECEEQLERVEAVLIYLSNFRRKAFYKRNESYYNGKYVAFHKSIEAVKRALEGKPYGN